MKVLLSCAIVMSLILVSACGASAPVSATAKIIGCPIPYAMVSAPNVNAPSGVMAIVPNKAGTSPNAAASLAKFARGQFRSVKSWKAMQVFVFRDLPTAQRFNAYQAKRKHWPLRAGDYVALRKLWPKALAVYEYRNGNEKVFFPARNPSGWWQAAR